MKVGSKVYGTFGEGRIIGLVVDEESDCAVFRVAYKWAVMDERETDLDLDATPEPLVAEDAAHLWM